MGVESWPRATSSPPTFCGTLFMHSYGLGSHCSRSALLRKSHATYGDDRFHPHISSTLATAATNGAVVLWNLEHKGPAGYMRVLKDHTRTVNRVCWHQADVHVLLSGSQDGCVKLWDVRAKASSSSFRLRAEQVRDVQFSPFYTSRFAAALCSYSLLLRRSRGIGHAPAAQPRRWTCI